MNGQNRVQGSRRRGWSLRRMFRGYCRWGIPKRKGSVLIVVIGLLLLLMLIGFTFITFSAQERSSAEYYAESAKVWSANPNSDILFDWALEQLIIGPLDSNAQSVLWPGDKSLVPRMLGIFGLNPASSANQEFPTVPLDKHAFNGNGVNIISSTTQVTGASGPVTVLTGAPYPDQNYDGIPDNGANGQPDNRHLLYLNTSPAALLPLGVMSYIAPGNGSYRPQYLNNLNNTVANFPTIDSGYTYPDINSPYLAYSGSVPQNVAGVNPLSVFTPTFHRPQYLRDPVTGAAIANWYQQTGGFDDTTARVLRPHPNHINIADNKTPRYVTAANGPIFNKLGVQIQPFPFAVDIDGDGIFNEEGIWYSNNTVAQEYDVDNDGDGVTDGVWIDENFPAMPLPDGRVMIPLFSYHVLDADALINLNAAGNIAGLMNFGQPFSGPPLASLGPGQTSPISRSDLGMSASEINPLWALTCNPNDPFFLSPVNGANNTPSPALQQYRGFLGRSNLNSAQYAFDRVETGNLDGLFLLWGRPSYSVTLNGNGGEVFVLNDLNIGRYGDASALLGVAQSGNPPAPTVNTQWPVAGFFNTDDDQDMFAGLTDSGDMGMYAFLFQGNAYMQYPLPLGTSLFPSIALSGTAPYLSMSPANLPAPFSQMSNPIVPYVPPFGQPLDFTGGGSWTMIQPTIGQIPNLYQPLAAANNPMRYLQYVGYQGWQGGFVIPYGGTLANLVVNQGIFGNNTLAGLVDEPDEMVIDPRYLQSSDQQLPIDETAALQLSQSDYVSVLGQSRVRQLAPLNLELGQQAPQIRRRFTTISEDRKTHGFVYDPTFSNTYDRRWEYGAGTATVASNWDNTPGKQFQFPPMAIGTPLDGQTPMSADTPTASGGQAEPFRMELAALIGAKLSDNATNAPNNAFLTPAYTLPLPPSTLIGTYGLTPNPWQQQARYNINRFLTTEDPYQIFGTTNTQSNPLRFRELTPHPNAYQWSQWQANSGGTPSAAIAQPPVGTQPVGSFAFPTLTSNTTFAGNPPLQEFWARRDRQQMARDIYVMLYMFGGGQDLIATASGTGSYSGTTNAATGGILYQSWQLAEMAQFAVNYVDALDRDDVITMFEYDTNLADGWNLDDNPMTADSMTGAAANSSRGVAYGVEAQQLAFSEALVIVSKMVTIKDSGVASDGKDHPATMFDDSKKDRTFAYLELQNLSPNGISLANQNWQIALLSPTATLGFPANGPPSNATNNANAYTVLTLQDPNGVGAGQFYTIGSRTYVPGSNGEPAGQPQSGTNSYFYVDSNWQGGNSPGNFSTPIVPAPLPAAGTVNLDLLNPNMANNFVLTDASYNGIGSAVPTAPTYGDFVNFLGLGNTNNAGMTNVAQAGAPFATTTPAFLTTFVLRRRLNLERPAPTINGTGTIDTNGDADNPWVEVDRIYHVNTAVTAAGEGNAVLSTPGTFFDLRDPNDTFTTSATVSDIQPKLQRLNSRERKQPLDGFEGKNTLVGAIPNAPVPPGAVNNTNATAALQGYSTRVNFYAQGTGTFTPNTIGQRNQQTSLLPNGPANTLWQPHFDRDFASVMELLSIPLYAPWNVTQFSAPPDQPSLNTLTSEIPVVPVPGSSSYLPLIAQSKFLRPQNPQNLNQAAATQVSQLDNRWYRVLELLEVPTRQNMLVENSLQAQFPWLSPSALQRVAARMNVNTLRNGENLFALMDDPNQFNIMPAGYNSPGNNGDGSYQDLYEFPGGASGVVRNWWFELVRSRDGVDPTVSSMLGYPAYLPGSPVSRPFRSLSFFNNSQTSYKNPITNANSTVNGLNSLDDTLLRTLAYDNPSPLNVSVNNTIYGANGNPGYGSTVGTQGRSLFEARSQTDLSSQTGQNQVDYYTRQRLLAKIAGNTTERSNVFLVWVTVGFFEVAQNPNNPQIVQIGAEMTDQTRRRGFFVVDRTLLEDAWVPTVPTMKPYTAPATGYYDYKKFIVYAKTIQ